MQPTRRSSRRQDIVIPSDAAEPLASVFLKSRKLVYGDKTVLRSGMVLAVDGSVSVEKTFRAQVGDSVIVTNDGYEQLTKHPNALEEVIL